MKVKRGKLPDFSNEDKAREYLEKIRWANGIECPHCGAIGEHYPLTAKTTSTRPVRNGVWKCKKCRKQFSVTVGTIFERSHIPLNKWLGVIYVLCSSKKGMSVNKLHQELCITYKSAWFMVQRIRQVMVDLTILKKKKGIVEADPLDFDEALSDILTVKPDKLKKSKKKSSH